MTTRYRLSLTICMCINMPIWLVVKNPYRSRARIRVKSLIFKRMYVRQRPSIPKSEGMIECFKRTLQQRRRPERWLGSTFPVVNYGLQLLITREYLMYPKHFNTTKEDFISYRPYNRAYRNISRVKCPQKYVERLKVAMQNAFDFA